MKRGEPRLDFKVAAEAIATTGIPHPRVIEAAYEETRQRILATPFLASLGDPLAASHAG